MFWKWLRHCVLSHTTGLTRRGPDGRCALQFYGGSDGFSPDVGVTIAWAKSILYNFMGGSDGFFPSASLVMTTDGAFYGTTSAGGKTSGDCVGNQTCGTIFALQPPSSPGSPWTETVLHRFTGTGGDAPLAGLSIGGEGILYGTTSAGGSGSCSSGCGTVFSLTPYGTAISALL